MDLKKTLLLLGMLLLVTSCYSTPEVGSPQTNLPNNTLPSPPPSPPTPRPIKDTPPPSPPAPRPVLVTFCEEHGGTFDLFQGVAACVSGDSVCTTAQYAQDKCVNFNRCAAKPAQCDPRVQPRAPSYCQNGEITTIKDSCGCVTGSLCKMP